jgi:hypothetical protein
MNDVKQLPRTSSTRGDAAVDGLIAGVCAGFVMGMYLILVGLISGESPAIIVARFGPSAGSELLHGILLHLAVAGFFGIVFGLVRWITIRHRSSRRIDWAIGLMYGLILFLLAQTVTLPQANSPLQATPLAHFMVAHLAFGLTLGTVINRIGDAQTR